MNDEEVEEILIKLPKNKFEKQASQFENFIFLDLIGMFSRDKAEEKKNEERHNIQMNRKAILRENVDCVFVFTEGRNMCDPIILKQMFKCGIFSNCDSVRPPKLTIVSKIRKADKIEIRDLEDTLNGFCQFKGQNTDLILKSLKTSICQAFDYTDIKITPLLNNTTDTVEIETLPLVNKSEHVPEMLKRAATICVLERSMIKTENALNYDIFYNQQTKISKDHLNIILSNSKIFYTNLTRDFEEYNE